MRHLEGTNCPQEIVVEFFERIKKLRIIFHNAKFDKAMVYTSTGKNLPVFADTMIYAALLSEPKGLKDLSFKFLNISSLCLVAFTAITSFSFVPSMRQSV